MDDHSLILAYSRWGDESAFAQLVERHLPLIYGTAYRDLRDHHLTQDLCQNVFIALGRAAQKDRFIHSVPAWLYGTTRKQVALMIRAERRRHDRERRLAEYAVAAQEDAPASQVDLIAFVQEDLATLSPNDQQLLFLRFYEGRSLRDVGQHLGVKEKTAQKRVERAVQRLSTLLSRRKLTLTASLLVPQVFTAGAVSPPTHLATSVTGSALAILAAPTPAWSLTPQGLASLGGGALAAIATVSILAQPPEWTVEEVSVVVAEQRSSLLTPRSSVKDASLTDLETIVALVKSNRAKALSRLSKLLYEDRVDFRQLTECTRVYAQEEPLRIAQFLVELYRLHQESHHAESIGSLIEISIEIAFELQPDNSANWVETLPRTDLAEAYAFEALLKCRARQSIPKALSELYARPHARDRALQVLGEILTELPMEQALATLAQTPESPTLLSQSHQARTAIWRQEAGRIHERFMALCFPQLYEKDATALASWILEQVPSPQSSQLIGLLVSHWSPDAPEAARMWISQLDGNEHRAATVALAQGWAQTDPEEALAWSRSLEDDALQDYAAEAAFAAWLDHSPKQARDWAQQTEGGNRQSRTFVALAVETLPAEEAYQWASSLSPGEHRDEALRRAFYKLGQSAPKFGRVHLERLPNSALYPSAHTFALGRLVNGGRQEVAAWKASLSPDSLLHHAIASAEVNLLASISPQLGAKVAFALPASTLRDPVVIQLIERTAHRSMADLAQARAWTSEIYEVAIRTETIARLDEIAAVLEKRPMGAVLPESTPSDFRSQPLDTLLEHLETLASIPTSRP